MMDEVAALLQEKLEMLRQLPDDDKKATLHTVEKAITLRQLLKDIADLRKSA